MELTVKHFDELSTCELYDILKARVAVFVVEQTCPYQELDGKDLSACHVLLRSKGQIAAYLRILPPEEEMDAVYIGRVLTRKRGMGLGRQIMLEGINAAKLRFNARHIFIEAQTYARGFYEQLGFEQISEEFLEDNIPHIKMSLAL